MKLSFRWTPRRVLVAVVLLGALLRAWAALLLPTDFDEPIYLQAAYDYAQALKAGNLNGVIDYPENREHPALVKLLYGGVVLALDGYDHWTNALYASRALSAAFGTLGVLLVALAGGPLAGGMLAVHTLAVKYTSQAYLEALPHFASVAAVLALQRSGSPRDRWFWLSALALGLAAAGKLTYLPVLIVLLYLTTWEKNFQWRSMVPYLIAAGALFWLLNPTLWHDPFSRLSDALVFHVRYSQSAPIQQTGYPWYQPLVWVATSAASSWHPEVFFYFGFDGIIFLLALGGLPREWRERRWLVVWMVSGILFLLLWPTKWPQYALVVIPALCLAAAESARQLYTWLSELEAYWEWLPQMLLRPPVYAWVVLGGFVTFITVVYLAGAVQLAAGRVGWSH
ncbi:MAG: transcriptional regulator, partial [Anaerolineales bacterium]